MRVVQIATAQDVGRALNPLSVIGQIEGGIAQGLGLAVMEEIVVHDGLHPQRRRSPTTCCRPPSTLPTCSSPLVEEPDPQAPLGAKGVGEPPCISATPAIVAAIRDATGRGCSHACRCARRTSPSLAQVRRMSPDADEREISTWPASVTASRDLARMVHDDGFEPDIILAIARGGLLVAGALGYALSVKNLYTMNVEYYTGVDERLDVPMILPPTPELGRSRRGPRPDRRRRRRHRPHARRS